VSVGARAALYTAERSVLAICRQAERAGFRIVTMVDEDVPGIGFAGTRLNALVDRLGGGEFEVIVADAGAGRVVVISAVSTEEIRADDCSVVAHGTVDHIVFLAEDPKAQRAHRRLRRDIAS